MKWHPNTKLWYNLVMSSQFCITWYPWIYQTQPLCVVSSMELLLLLENFVILLKPMRSAMSKKFPQDWRWRFGSFTTYFLFSYPTFWMHMYMKKRPSGQKQLQLLPLLVIIYHKHVYCNCLSEKKNVAIM